MGQPISLTEGIEDLGVRMDNNNRREEDVRVVDALVGARVEVMLGVYEANVIDIILRESRRFLLSSRTEGVMDWDLDIGNELSILDWYVFFPEWNNCGTSTDLLPRFVDNILRWDYRTWK